MQIRQAASAAVASDCFEVTARKETVEVAAALRVARRTGARIRRRRCGRRCDGCLQSAGLELQLAGEEHAYAEELRGGSDVRQGVPQEVYFGSVLCMWQRGGDAHLRAIRHAIIGGREGQRWKSSCRARAPMTLKDRRPARAAHR